jgi:hypothetical protein
MACSISVLFVMSILLPLASVVVTIVVLPVLIFPCKYLIFLAVDLYSSRCRKALSIFSFSELPFSASAEARESSAVMPNCLASPLIW